MDHATQSGLLILAGTPIGNTDDATPALRQALSKADVVAAEDTRRFRALVDRLGWEFTARVVSYFDGNETARAAELIEDLNSGATVVVVTDAGMPTVSDPGYRVVSAAIEADIPIRVIPGPSAVLVALALSGLPTDRFCFEGFLPRKTEQRRRRLAQLANEERTMVFFEAPHRVASFLADAVAGFGGGRRGSISRELTKTYEETQRGTLDELSTWAAAGLRGEVTIVIAGAEGSPIPIAEAVALVLERLAAGERFAAAVATVAEQCAVPRKALYSAALAARKESP